MTGGDAFGPRFVAKVSGTTAANDLGGHTFLGDGVVEDTILRRHALERASSIVVPSAPCHVTRTLVLPAEPQAVGITSYGDDVTQDPVA